MRAGDATTPATRHPSATRPMARTDTPSRSSGHQLGADLVLRLVDHVEQRSEPRDLQSPVDRPVRVNGQASVAVFDLLQEADERREESGINEGDGREIEIHEAHRPPKRSEGGRFQRTDVCSVELAEERKPN